MSRRKGPMPTHYINGAGVVKPRDPAVPYLSFSACSATAPQPHYHWLHGHKTFHVCPIHYSNPLLATPEMIRDGLGPITIGAALASMPPGTEVRVFQQSNLGGYLGWPGGSDVSNAAAVSTPPAPPAAWEGPCAWCARYAHPHRGWCPTLVTDAQWVDMDRKRLASKVRANSILSCGPR
jgi:hypothetical protein